MPANNNLADASHEKSTTIAPDRAESPDEIVRRMAQLRTSLDDRVDKVIDQARVFRDWRLFVRRYPWGCVTVAAAIGFAVVPVRRPSPVEATTADAGVRFASTSHARRLRSTMIDVVEKAALAFAVKQLFGALDRVFSSDGVSAETSGE